jgi:hypothetical protein
MTGIKAHSYFGSVYRVEGGKSIESQEQHMAFIFIRQVL